ncbi:MAG: bifunctional diguanylate cyclase/phosphodiesterase, partial [Micavibrio sp.]|nr:bifunctional diguanylate cyclase/phosphodiesterase [Micavibrio sp.]
VVTIDLDHFKDINDSMGHNVGDAILRSVAKRLRAAMPEEAVVSRSGEDEYAIMMPLGNHGLTSSRDVAEKVINVIRLEPFRVFNETFQVRASIGVSTFPDDGLEPDQVLKNADIALNRAKEEGRDSIKEYSEDFDRAVQARFQMLRDLRDAMEQEQLKLFYQPQLDLKTGEIIGAEALLRWWKPDQSKEGGSYISPAEFIPVAEQSGLIVPIGEWVMKTACEDVKSWKDEHGLDFRVAVNVSPAQFTQSDLCAFTQEVIETYGIAPQKLELEVTESVFMDDIHQTIQTLQNLHAMGVELAIDDFGTGYSSLSYLRQFPIDRLKIDQSFIRNALNDPDDASIARTIIALGRALGLKVIAEGVETVEHEKFLVNEGCDEVQGFRYSRPIPMTDFIKFAKEYNGKLDSFSS